MRLIVPVLRKEIREIRRDPYTLAIAVILPLVLMLLFGYGINLDAKNISTVVFDKDRSVESRLYIQRYVNSGYFNIVDNVNSFDTIYDLMDRDVADVALIIPEDFARKLAGGHRTTVQTVVDGSFPPTAKVAVGYSEAISAAASRDRVTEFRQRMGKRESMNPVRTEARVWYNPSLKSKNFIVPGLFAVILMAFPPLLSALSVVKEKERGSVQQILISPVKPYEFIIGKMIPYGAIAFIEMLVILGTALFLFKVPFQGSLLLFLLISALYVLCTVSIGLLVSTITQSQVAAMLMALVITVMPSFLFSGFIYPIFNMPVAIQVYTYLFPARYFIEISRGILLKGVGLEYLWVNLGLLLVYTLLVIAAGALGFRRRLG